MFVFKKSISLVLILTTFLSTTSAFAMDPRDDDNGYNNSGVSYAHSDDDSYSDEEGNSDLSFGLKVGAATAVGFTLLNLYDRWTGKPKPTEEILAQAAAVGDSVAFATTAHAVKDVVQAPWMPYTPTGRLMGDVVYVGGNGLIAVAKGAHIANAAFDGMAAGVLAAKATSVIAAIANGSAKRDLPVIQQLINPDKSRELSDSVDSDLEEPSSASQGDVKVVNNNHILANPQEESTERFKITDYSDFSESKY